MKKFIFALLAFVFTSFAFASPPLEVPKQKIEFAKQVADYVVVVAYADQEIVVFVNSERKLQSNKELAKLSSYFSDAETINFHPIPITDIYKEWHYVIDKRNLQRILLPRDFKL